MDCNLLILLKCLLSLAVVKSFIDYVTVAVK